MSGFSPEWLTLREPLDTAARDATLPARLADRCDRSKPVTLVDLGGGTGANLRFIAPRLGGAQEWLLVDNDPVLLQAAQTMLTTWARGIGARWLGQGDTLHIEHSAFECRIRPQVLDLAGDLAGLTLDGVHCVTASALLDLVSEAWLRELAERCRMARVAVCFALTYDGRMRWQPRDPFDARVRHGVNRHQLTDKGFGPALGPHATAACKTAFGRQGYHLAISRSDWRIGPVDGAVQTALLTDWTQAAQVIAPEQAAERVEWRQRRRRHIDAARSRLLVGHRDVLGWL